MTGNFTPLDIDIFEKKFYRSKEKIEAVLLFVGIIITALLALFVVYVFQKKM